MNGDETRAVRYLLGTLSEAEAEAFSEEMFASDATFSALEEAENGLVEAYLDDTLSPDDRMRFESLVRSSPHLQERLEVERGLLGAARRRRPAPRAAQWLPWAAAVVLGFSGGGLALQANRAATRARSDSLAREQALTARLTEQDARVRDLERQLSERPAPPLATWRLVAMQRDASDRGAFRATASVARLQVPVPPGPPGASYRARVTRPEGDFVFGADGLAAVSAPDGTFVDVLAPGARLPHGTYILSLSRAGGRELGPFSFSVR